jgi:DNA-binding IclR family transcriptional regulator
MKDRLLLNSVVKTFKLLETVCISKESFTLSDLSKLLNLSIGATQRITHTLILMGYLHRDLKTKTFGTTPKILSLGYNHLSIYEIREIALPFMRELNEQINEVVNLAIIDNDEIFYIERFETSHSLTTNVRVGSRKPLHCTSIGKVLLAFLPQNEQEEVLTRISLEKFNANTITDKNKLRNQLKKIREKGYSENLSEMTEGLFSVAVPLINHEERAVAGMNIVIPLSRLNREKVSKEFLPLLIGQGQKVSAKLSGRGEV